MIQLKLDKTKKYLLACSYGPDSMALFYLLKKDGYNFDCAIVNYHLRKESSEEVNGLLDYASTFAIKVYVKEVHEKIIKNIESRCRDIRYSFFSELCDQNQYDSVLVAHHQDDILETYLMQIERQNCPIYYGIKEKTVIKGVNIARPLLPYTKSELQELCCLNNVPFSIDKTNFDVTIKRNKIRHQIIAQMSKSERAKLLKEIDNKNAALSKMFNSFNLDKIYNVKYLLSLEGISQQYALNYLVKKIDESLYLSKENVGQVIDILKSCKTSGQFPVKRGLYLIKEYDEFAFSTHLLRRVDYNYIFNSPGKLDTPYFYLDFSGDTSNRNVKAADYPLTIRSIKNNDTYIINGYKVTGNRLMIDWKVPLRKRIIWPVIVSTDNRVIYIPRYQKEFKPDSKINFYVK